MNAWTCISGDMQEGWASLEETVFTLESKAVCSILIASKSGSTPSAHAMYKQCCSDCNNAMRLRSCTTQFNTPPGMPVPLHINCCCFPRNYI